MSDGAAPAEPTRTDPFGLRESGELVRRTGLLLRQHWLPLLALAAAGLVGREFLAELAVVAGRAGAVPGFLALALVPLSGLAALVGMLLVVRSREARRTDLGGVLAATGSVLVPYLVIYESKGDLRQDLLNYARAGVWEDIARDQEFDRLPQIGSWLVLAIVVAALLVRGIGHKVVGSRRWKRQEDPRRGLVQIVTGYSEAVWVTLGAWVVTGLLSNAELWWQHRVVAQGIFDFWAGVRFDVPVLGAVGDWVTSVLPLLTDAVVTGLVVPLSMLTLAVVVYGLQVVDTVTPEDVVAAVTRGRLGALRRRVGDVPLQQAWNRLSDPEGRFGVLLGGAALVVRSAFAPVLTFCVLFTLVSQLDLIIWWLARLLLGYRTEIVWAAWYYPLNGVAEIVTLVLTVALTAVFADRLLTRFGASGQLRQRHKGRSTKEAGGKAGEVTRAATGSASSGSSTSTD